MPYGISSHFSEVQDFLAGVLSSGGNCSSGSRCGSGSSSSSGSTDESHRITDGSTEIRNIDEGENADGNTGKQKKAKQKKTRVLIHCVMGQNRSATVLCAFLMKRLGWSAREAVDHVSKRRNGILSEGHT